MDKIWIQGGAPLFGDVTISGSKNATLPLMAASLLTDQPITLSNIPCLQDILSMCLLLETLGCFCDFNKEEKELTIGASNLLGEEAPYDIVRKMRASIVVLGPLLARLGHAKVSLPGGCAIGARPVNLHIEALQKFGAVISIEEGYIIAQAPKGLQGAAISFPTVTVTGTANVLMAATLAKGETIITNAAREPEIIDLGTMLLKMGAKIEGLGTDTLKIQGVAKLAGACHQVMADRIETGTYICAAAITRGCLTLHKASLQALPTFKETLASVGVRFDPLGEAVKIDATHGELMATDMITEPFPGFATDLQAQFMALMTMVKGASMITETIFENRFMHVPELQRMGADIKIQGRSALIRGVNALNGAPVMATDLRASVSLVLAGLAARGETVVNRVYHLDRGYENIEEKLSKCGARIKRVH